MSRRPETDLDGRPLRSQPILNGDHDPDAYLRPCPACGGGMIIQAVIRTATGGFVSYTCARCMEKGSDAPCVAVPHSDRLLKHAKKAQADEWRERRRSIAARTAGRS